MTKMECKKLTELKNNECCVFCGRNEVNELKYGAVYSYGNIITHYFCLLLSSNVSQNGQDEEGIFGFLPADILKEVKRGKRLGCVYCKSKGATIGCTISKCKVIFHLPCGIARGTFHQYYDQFRSYCSTHRKRQTICKSVLAVVQGESLTCGICHDDLQLKNLDTMWAPCCQKSAFFHRLCVQQMANSFGGYAFKCPLCNDQSKFTNAMKEFGIFIPEQDASWEREPNAYQELLHRHSMCDSVKCICPHGRDFNKKLSTLWQIILCHLCGSQGIHKGCSNKRRLNRWECDSCTTMLSEGPASEDPVQETTELQPSTSRALRESEEDNWTDEKEDVDVESVDRNAPSPLPRRLQKSPTCTSPSSPGVHSVSSTHRRLLKRRTTASSPPVQPPVPIKTLRTESSSPQECDAALRRSSDQESTKSYSSMRSTGLRNLSRSSTPSQDSDDSFKSEGYSDGSDRRTNGATRENTTYSAAQSFLPAENRSRSGSTENRSRSGSTENRSRSGSRSSSIISVRSIVREISPVIILDSDEEGEDELEVVADLSNSNVLLTKDGNKIRIVQLCNTDDKAIVEGDIKVGKIGQRTFSLSDDNEEVIEVGHEVRSERVVECGIRMSTNSSRPAFVNSLVGTAAAQRPIVKERHIKPVEPNAVWRSRSPNSSKTVQNSTPTSNYQPFRQRTSDPLASPLITQCDTNLVYKTSYNSDVYGSRVNQPSHQTDHRVFAANRESPTIDAGSGIDIASRTPNQAQLVSTPFSPSSSVRDCEIVYSANSPQEVPTNTPVRLGSENSSTRIRIHDRPLVQPQQPNPLSTVTSSQKTFQPHQGLPSIPRNPREQAEHRSVVSSNRKDDSKPRFALNRSERNTGQYEFKRCTSRLSYYKRFADNTARYNNFGLKELQVVLRPMIIKVGRNGDLKVMQKKSQKDEDKFKVLDSGYEGHNALSKLQLSNKTTSIKCDSNGKNGKENVTSSDANLHKPVDELWYDDDDGHKRVMNAIKKKKYRRGKNERVERRTPASNFIDDGLFNHKRRNKKRKRDSLLMTVMRKRMKFNKSWKSEFESIASMDKRYTTHVLNHLPSFPEQISTPNLCLQLNEKLNLTPSRTQSTSDTHANDDVCATNTLGQDESHSKAETFKIRFIKKKHAEHKIKRTPYCKEWSSYKRKKHTNNVDDHSTRSYTVLAKPYSMHLKQPTLFDIFNKTVTDSLSAIKSESAICSNENAHHSKPRKVIQRPRKKRTIESSKSPSSSPDSGFNDSQTVLTENDSPVSMLNYLCSICKSIVEESSKCTKICCIMYQRSMFGSPSSRNSATIKTEMKVDSCSSNHTVECGSNEHFDEIVNSTGIISTIQNSSTFKTDISESVKDSLSKCGVHSDRSELFSAIRFPCNSLEILEKLRSVQLTSFPIPISLIDDKMSVGLSVSGNLFSKGFNISIRINDESFLSVYLSSDKPSDVRSCPDVGGHSTNIIDNVSSLTPVEDDMSLDIVKRAMDQKTPIDYSKESRFPSHSLFAQSEKRRSLIVKSCFHERSIKLEQIDDTVESSKQGLALENNASVTEPFRNVTYNFNNFLELSTNNEWVRNCLDNVDKCKIAFHILPLQMKFLDSGPPSVRLELRLSVSKSVVNCFEPKQYNFLLGSPVSCLLDTNKQMVSVTETNGGMINNDFDSREIKQEQKLDRDEKSENNDNKELNSNGFEREPETLPSPSKGTLIKEEKTSEEQILDKKITPHLCTALNEIQNNLQSQSLPRKQERKPKDINVKIVKHEKDNESTEIYETKKTLKTRKLYRKPYKRFIKKKTIMNICKQSAQKDIFDANFSEDIANYNKVLQRITKVGINVKPSLAENILNSFKRTSDVESK